MDFIKEFTQEKLAGSQIKVTGEIPETELEAERAKAIAYFGKDMKVDGFRPGHVPEKVIVERVGEMAIVTEMSERALARLYPHILKELNIDAIGYPKIEITKIAPKNPLGFTATIAVMPEITLPDYREIAKNANADRATTEVSETEVEDQIKIILRQKVAYERLQKKAQPSDNTEHIHDENCDHSDDINTTEDNGSVDTPEGDASNLPLPELTDALVQTLGQPGQFTTVDEFKAKLKEHLVIEKERDVKASHRAKITDLIIAETKVELPSVLIEAEINQMFSQMNEDLSRANLKMEDYLKHIKKTREDLEKEWAPAAEKRATLQLVLNEIAKKDSITPNTEVVEKQVEELLKQYSDADPERVRVYVTTILQNEAVMNTLEEVK
jgi:trigger factor